MAFKIEDNENMTELENVEIKTGAVDVVLEISDLEQQNSNSNILDMFMCNISTSNVTDTDTNVSVFESKLIIPLYVIIFVLAVGGNSLVLLTLIRNKRMRTVTNVYLLNLAISDLLLGVFCMPFTLVGQVLRTFIFGSTMCKLIPYIQAVSVSVGVWTLVAISLERYFAICRPLKSRRWQTQFHAYKMIIMVWLASLCWSAPVLVVSSLLAMKRGYKCRENWPNKESERIFNLFLDVMLLLIPMLIMSFAYFLIMNKLWKGLQREIEHNSSYQKQMFGRTCSSPTINELYAGNNNSTSQSNTIPMRNLKKNSPRLVTTFVKKSAKDCIIQITPPSNKKKRKSVSLDNVSLKYCEGEEEHTFNSEVQRVNQTTYTFTRNAIRSNNMNKSIVAKKKVIRMLFVIVAEFFICWAPLHFINTWYLFYPEQVYKQIGSTGVALIQLLAYISCCCNPITYCFMNRKFRQAFLTLFQRSNLCCCCSCGKKLQEERHVRILKMAPNSSDVSCNESTVYVRRHSILGRSELLGLENEERV